MAKLLEFVWDEQIVLEPRVPSYGVEPNEAQIK